MPLKLAKRLRQQVSLMCRCVTLLETVVTVPLFTFMGLGAAEPFSVAREIPPLCPSLTVASAVSQCTALWFSGFSCKLAK